MTKKATTLRERRLIIKRDGSAIIPSDQKIRDDINSVLAGCYVQQVKRDSSNNLTLTTMETVKATSLNAKVSQFLHLIPGTTTVHLDTPSVHLIVYGLPTSHSWDVIAQKPPTFNPGL